MENCTMALDWNADGVQCPQCKNVLLPSNIETARGIDGEIELTIRNLPCLRCPADHQRLPTSADFVETLLDALFDAPDFPTVKAKGLFRKSAVCPGCEGLLSQPAAPARFEVAMLLRQPGEKHEVELDHATLDTDASPCRFVVDLRCPARTCGVCGTVASTASRTGVLNALTAMLELL